MLDPIVMFGMSQTFLGAIISRCLLGLSNGVVGTTKTVVSELAQGNEWLEMRGMALVTGMRGWGFHVSPALGGSLAEVTKQYPNAPWVQRHEGFLSEFPFLLPYIVGAVAIHCGSELLSIVTPCRKAVCGRDAAKSTVFFNGLLEQFHQAVCPSA